MKKFKSKKKLEKEFNEYKNKKHEIIMEHIITIQELESELKKYKKSFEYWFNRSSELRGKLDDIIEEYMEVLNNPYFLNTKGEIK